jgi:SAM-dependent methyltransferase
VTTVAFDHQQLSSFFLKAFQRSGLDPPARILDLPCGFGRHSRWLAGRGFSVTAVDIDLNRLGSFWPASPATSVTETHPVLADGRSSLPFRPRTFDMVVMIHWHVAGAVARAKDCVDVGGYFLFESVSGHGENWRELPKRGAIADELGREFDLVEFQERPVEPQHAGAAVVKLLGRRI